MARVLMIGLLLAAWGSAAVAADPAPLPSLALDPPPSPWHGLWVATSVVAAGGKGTKGFVGGDLSAGYDRVLGDGTILGVGAATGVTPGFSGFGALRAYDFATINARMAFPTGRWTPYVASDLVFAKPSSRLSGGFKALDSTNDLFNGPERLDVGGTVGAGFDYALTSDTSVGFGVSVHRGTAAVFP